MYTIESDGVMILDDTRSLPYPANKFMDENLNRCAELFLTPTPYDDPAPKIKILRNNLTRSYEGVVVDRVLPEKYVSYSPWYRAESF